MAAHSINISYHHVKMLECIATVFPHIHEVDKIKLFEH